MTAVRQWYVANPGLVNAAFAALAAVVFLVVGLVTKHNRHTADPPVTNRWDNGPDGPCFTSDSWKDIET